MTQPDIIRTILKDSNYHLDLFTEKTSPIPNAPNALMRITSNRDMMIL